MSLTHKDVCKKLGENDNGNWQLCFDKDSKPFFINTKNDLKASNKGNVIPIIINWTSEKPNAEEIKETILNFDWQKIYDESIKIHMFENNRWIERNTYIYIDDKTHFSFIIPKKIEGIFQKRTEKTADDGRREK